MVKEKYFCADTGVLLPLLLNQISLFSIPLKNLYALVDSRIDFEKWANFNNQTEKIHESIPLVDLLLN